MRIGVAMQIQFHPELRSRYHLFMLEPIGFRAETGEAGLTVELWTDVVHADSPDGTWHGIRMSRSTSEGLYQTMLRPTGSGDFRFTYRYCQHRRMPPDWEWAGEPTDDGHLTVAPPDPERLWTQGPSFAWVMEGMAVGNVWAAREADRHGFDAVLNLAEEFPDIVPSRTAVEYRHIPLRDGANHPIPEPKIEAAVTWVNRQLRTEHRVLINCRAGIGRSGSIAVAVVYANNRSWPYRRALDFTRAQKPDIYPHRGLPEALARVFPRI